MNLIRYYTFRDSKLSVSLPSQLKLRKGVRFFTGKINKQPHHLLVLIPSSLAHKRGMRKVILKGPKHLIWEGSEITQVRQGRCTFGDGGIEVLVSHVRLDEQTVPAYRAVTFFKMGKRHVFVDFSGGGDLVTFDEIRNTILSSIELHD